MESGGRALAKGRPLWFAPLAWVFSALQGMSLAIALAHPETLRPIWLYIMVLGFATLFASPMILWDACRLVRREHQAGQKTPSSLWALIAAHAAATVGLLVLVAWRVLR